MARSTFEGPILSGNNRFGPQRDVGYTTLTQNAYLDLLNTTANTAGYSGGSSVTVRANEIPNQAATIYTPSSVINFPTAAVTPTADSATNIYRTFVMYLPTGCDVDQALVDVAVVPTVTSGTISTIKVYVSNTFASESDTPRYCATGNITAVGRQAVTFSGAQVTNCNGTSVDLSNVNNQDNLSQVVFTVSIVGTSLTTLSAGQIYLAFRYVQPDPSIGNSTTYPYGNFD